MKKALIVLIVFTTVLGSVNAQVGIGVATPNAKSILDLTNNTNGKALILPSPISPPDVNGNFDTMAMVYYYNDNIYLRTSTTINVLSPWQYDGVTTNGFYSTPGIAVGIGIAPLTSSPSLLTIADYGDVTVSTSTASVVIGDDDFSSTHMLIDMDEILVKTNANTAGILKLQEGGGSVQVGESQAVQSDLNVFGKVQESGYDLIPQGVIVMWAGTTPPNGWAICDGTWRNSSDFSDATSTASTDATHTYQTPDLSGRFIVGYDASDADYSAIGVNGNLGQKQVSLTSSQLPAHQHEAASNGATINITASGSHTHPYTDRYMYVSDWDVIEDCGNCGTDLPHNQQSGEAKTTSSSTHTHSNGNFAGETGNGVGLSGSAHENRPPYYALAYIIKL